MISGIDGSAWAVVHDKKGKHNHMPAFFYNNAETDDTYRIYSVYVKDGILMKDFTLAFVLLITNDALKAREIKADNKRISIFNIYPSTLQFSVKG